MAVRSCRVRTWKCSYSGSDLEHRVVGPSLLETFLSSGGFAGASLQDVSDGVASVPRFWLSAKEVGL